MPAKGGGGLPRNVLRRWPLNLLCTRNFKTNMLGDECRKPVKYLKEQVVKKKNIFIFHILTYMTKMVIQQIKLIHKKITHSLI